MDCYLDKGYARLAQPSLTKPRVVWYLPIFTVQNPAKPKKVRIVWDAAAKVNGISLNDLLMSGPDLNEPLMRVLLRFRQGPWAVVGDIKEMFHQVLAREEDRPAMRFFWSKNSDTVHEYEMCVMSFGATCSPTIAQYVKNKNASDHAGVYPAAALSVKRNTYVDDWLVSEWIKDKLTELTQEVQAINRAAGFEMGKWICNHKEIASWLVISNSELGLDNMCENKVLGMKWLVHED